MILDKNLIRSQCVLGIPNIRPTLHSQSLISQFLNLNFLSNSLLIASFVALQAFSLPKFVPGPIELATCCSPRC
jgi:hypothetical protein